VRSSARGRKGSSLPSFLSFPSSLNITYISSLCKNIVKGECERGEVREKEEEEGGRGRGRGSEITNERRRRRRRKEEEGHLENLLLLELFGRHLFSPIHPIIEKRVEKEEKEVEGGGERRWRRRRTLFTFSFLSFLFVRRPKNRIFEFYNIL